MLIEVYVLNAAKGDSAISLIRINDLVGYLSQCV